MTKRDELLVTVITTADYMARWDVLSDDVMDWIDAAIKTTSYYDRVMWKAVRDAYNGLLTAFEFEDIMLKQISYQFRRGWLAGLRELGLSMTPEMEAELQAAMVEEIGYVQKLMDDIRQAAIDESGYDQFRDRVRMWAHRYDEMRNRALLFAGGNTLLTWELGNTEIHCDGSKGNDKNCLSRAGMTKPAADWNRDVRPQSRELECGGWRCDCRLVMVDTGMLFAPRYR